MRLRSEKLANTNEQILKRKNNRKMVNPSNNNAEQTLPQIGVNTIDATTFEEIPSSQGTSTIPSTTVSKTIPSTKISTSIPSNTQSIPNVSSTKRHGQPTTPRTLGFNASRPYTLGFLSNPNPYPANSGFHQLTRVRVRVDPVGLGLLSIPTSTYTNHLTSTFSPLRGPGSGIQPPGFASQFPPFTTNSSTILRQQKDENNHVIMGVLA